MIQAEPSSDAFKSSLQRPAERSLSFTYHFKYLIVRSVQQQQQTFSTHDTRPFQAVNYSQASS
uniref:Uncharacterized protein n=1 Tax=Hyaloperonospora arabidopsidis (strain Emoy2) TaxID=559515 RepID=M4BBY2_HYAAE